MSLSISNVVFSGTAIGEAVTLDFRLTSTHDLTAKPLTIDLGLFVDAGLPIPEHTGGLPYGYNYTLGGPITLIPGTHASQDLYIKTASVVDNFNIDFTFGWILTSDRLGGFSALTLEHNEGFKDSSITAPVDFQNTSPSVYLDNKALRITVVEVDVCSNCVNQVVHDEPTSLRFYEQGLNGGAAKFKDFAIRLERNGVEVSDFSTFEPTSIILTVDDNGLGLAPSAELLIYATRSNNQNDLIADTSLKYYDNGLPTIGGLPLLGHNNWTNIGGNVYEANFIMDPAAFDPGQSYRVIGLAEDVGLTCKNSFITQTPIAAKATPAVTCGTMSGEITDYNDIYTGNCLTVAPLERLKVCNEVAKAGYNAEAAANGALGTFNTNFSSVELSATVLGEVTPIFTVRSTNNELPTEDLGGIFRACYNFRITEAMAGRSLSLRWRWTYTLNNPLGGSYIDTVDFYQLINVLDLENDRTTPEILSIEFLDLALNPITEICDDQTDLFKIRVTKNITTNYNVIAVIKPDTLGVTIEEEDYNNLLLDQLDTPQIVSMPVLFDGLGVAILDVDPTELDRDTKYNFYVIAKEQVVSPGLLCDPIRIEADIEVIGAVIGGVPASATVRVNFNITVLGVGAVNSVTVDSFGSQEPTIIQTDIFATSSGTFDVTINWPDGFTGLFQTLTNNFTVVLDNGCTYQALDAGGFNWFINPQIGLTSNQQKVINGQ